MKCHVQKSNEVTEPATPTSRKWSDWLSYPTDQCVGVLCGATWLMSTPAKATSTFGPGLRKRSTCRPNGTDVGDCALARRSHLGAGWAPWLLPRSLQNNSSAMAILHDVNAGSPKSTALMSKRGDASSSR